MSMAQDHEPWLALMPNSSAGDASKSNSVDWGNSPSLHAEMCIYNITNGTIRPITTNALPRIIIDVYVVGSLCLFGFVGNALSIAVLYRDHDKKNTTNWLLQTLAVVDTIYLMASIFIQPIKTINEQTNWIPGLRNTYPYMERYTWVGASIAQTITVWTVLLVTLDRYMAICKPLSTQLRSLERAKLAVTTVVVVAVLYNIPMYFEREVRITMMGWCGRPTPTVVMTELRKSPIYYAVYKTLCFFIFRSIGPLLTIVILNYRLIKALQEVRRRHEDLTRSTKHRENITLMLVVVVCVFIVCTLPDLTFRIIVLVYDFLPDRALPDDTIQFINAVTNMLLVVNSSINFLIYCLIGKKFRKILKSMYTCGRPATVTELSETEPLTTRTTCGTNAPSRQSEAEPLTTIKTNETKENANGGVKDGDVSL